MSEHDEPKAREIKFNPPTFERWLGRLQMLRTGASMGAFALVWLVGTNHGLSWEVAAVRGIVAGIVFYFFAWAMGLLIFAELHEADIRRIRRTIEDRERERAQRMEQIYLQRLQQETDASTPASASGGGRYGATSSIGGPIGGGTSSSASGGYADQSQRFAA